MGLISGGRHAEVIGIQQKGAKLLIPKTLLHKKAKSRAWTGGSKGHMGELIALMILP